jgi:hypothetical protein
MRRIHAYKTEALLLSRSNIGSVNKCRCCDSYHLSVGNITLRLTHRDILNLTEMLIEALELDAICDLGEKRFTGEDA